VVDSWTFSFTPTSTTYTAGGVISLIYNSSASTAAAGTLAASALTSMTNAGVAIPYLVAPASNTSVPNKSLVIQNATAAFATGTGTANVIVNYQIITL
jgi:hypothetical protein